MDVINAVIAITGPLSIWLTQWGNKTVERYACIVGMIGQPFWIVSTYNPEQWGMFLTSIVITLAWMRGIWQHWLAPRWRPVATES